MNRTMDVVTATLATVLRFGGGLVARPTHKRPEKPIELYDQEGSSACRLVREAICELSLDALIYPCPLGGSRFRSALIERAGRFELPFLADPNTGRELFHAHSIVHYLSQQYASLGVSLPIRLSRFADVTSHAASTVRLARGQCVRSSREPGLPLELYSFEASPYCRIVREVLSELELPYLLHNVPKKSPMRRAFIEQSGKMMVPYLIDRNTGISMFESADIVRYLTKTYAV